MRGKVQGPLQTERYTDRHAIYVNKKQNILYCKEVKRRMIWYKMNTNAHV